MSETKTVTVTCEFGVEVPVELDLDKSGDYGQAVEFAALAIHQRGMGEIREAITDIEYE